MINSTTDTSVPGNFVKYKATNLNFGNSELSYL